MIEKLREDASQADTIKTLNQIIAKLNEVERLAKHTAFERALLLGYAGHTLRNQIEEAEQYLNSERWK